MYGTCLTILQLILLQVAWTDISYGFINNIALLKVPAKLGSTAEIRCTSIVKGYRACRPSSNKDCRTIWTKDDTTIESGEKYKVNSKTTTDYCDNFGKTNALVQELGFRAEKEAQGYDIGECFVSTLTIYNVEKSDLGIYYCNFSDHSPMPYRKYFELNNVTLVNVATDEKQSAATVFLMQSIARSKRGMLAQCVVTGEHVNWFTFLKSDYNNCQRLRTTKEMRDCLSENSAKLNELNELDDMDPWRCFNTTSISHQPLPDVFESFVYIQNICVTDWVGLYCSPSDSSPSVPEYQVFITKNRSEPDSWEKEFGINIAAIVISCFVAILFIIAIVVACCRMMKTSPSNYRILPVHPEHRCD